MIALWQDEDVAYWHDQLTSAFDTDSKSPAQKPGIQTGLEAMQVIAEPTAAPSR
jgi:hypothetical protein